MSRIVVGVDPSPAGTAAVEWALAEAVATGASLQVVRAWTYSAYAAEALVYAAPAGEAVEAAGAQLEADEQLKLASERVGGADTVACTTSTALGAASQVLIAAAGSDATIVVGSRGHGALSRAVLGSVSSSVLHHATGPVVVVPEPQVGDGAAARVIVGVDHSPAALAALSVAAGQARRRGATLVPVYVHEPIEMPRGGPHPPDPALLEDSERHMLQAAATGIGAADVQVEVLVGHPGEQLLSTARPQDLIVLGSRGRGGFTGLLLGSVSTQIAQHAPCPVIVVRA